MRQIYFKSCEHHLFENNCEKLRNLLVTNFYIFKLKNPLEFEDFYIKMGEYQDQIWWTKEDRKLLFLRITSHGIVMYLRRNILIQAYDENQPIDIKNKNYIALKDCIITDEDDTEILNILDKVFGMKTPYPDSKWLTGFNIETRKI